MKSSKNSIFRSLFWLAALLALAGLAWKFLATGGERPQFGMEAPPVRIATAKAQNVPYFLNGLGTVVPSADVLVRSRVDGQLIRLHFQEGIRVKAGDLLAEIDPRPFEASLSQARANLAKDQAQLENARRDLDRYSKLAKGDYIATQQYETQRALVRQYEGTVAADKAAVDSAKLQLEYSRITAPVGGRLGLRNVDEGNQIKSSDAAGIVRITELAPSHVIFTLPEANVPLITRALRERELDPELPPLLVEAWDREQKGILATGELLSLDNQIDTTTGTVRLKAIFANKDRALYPNQFVNARLRVRTMQDAVTVPVAAVQLGARGTYVYVLTRPGEAGGAKNGPATGQGGRPGGPESPGAKRSGKGHAPGAGPDSGQAGRAGGPGKGGQDGADMRQAQIREVTTSVNTNRVVVIASGLKAGEVVVVDGLDRLRDGAMVRVAASMETPLVEPPQAEPAR